MSDKRAIKEIIKPYLSKVAEFCYKVAEECPTVSFDKAMEIIKSVEQSLDYNLKDDNDAIIIDTRDDLYDVIQDVVFMHAPEVEEPEYEDEAIDIDLANEWTSELYDFFLKNYKFVFEEEEEQQRRDEKNGLYPDKEDIAN